MDPYTNVPMIEEMTQTQEKLTTPLAREGEAKVANGVREEESKEELNEEEEEDLEEEVEQSTKPPTQVFKIPTHQLKKSKSVSFAKALKKAQQPSPPLIRRRKSSYAHKQKSIESIYFWEIS